MNIAERFTRAVGLLPEEVRARLDGGAPLDWAALESDALGADIGRAVAAPRLLPESVETLVLRLIEDVGIVPGDVALGEEREGAAAGWLHWVKVEGFGESYQIRNERSGEVHTGVRPESVAGYATIALELAAALHDAGTRWTEAGERHRGTAEDGRGALARCAVWMHARLGASAETNGERPSRGRSRPTARARVEFAGRRGALRARRSSAQHRPWRACPAQELLRAGRESLPSRLRPRGDPLAESACRTGRDGGTRGRKRPYGSERTGTRRGRTEGPGKSRER